MIPSMYRRSLSESMKKRNNEQLTRIRKRLQHWNYANCPLVQLDREDAEQIIELIKWQEHRVNYQRKKYLERIGGSE